MSVTRGVEGDVMANLSQKKRKHMLNFLNELKEKHKSEDDMLIAINEIENALNDSNFAVAKPLIYL